MERARVGIQDDKTDLEELNKTAAGEVRCDGDEGAATYLLRLLGEGHQPVLYLFESGLQLAAQFMLRAHFTHLQATASSTSQSPNMQPKQDNMHVHSPLVLLVDSIRVCDLHTFWNIFNRAVCHHVITVELKGIWFVKSPKQQK